MNIGADVPFFIRGGTQIGQETGAKLSPITKKFEAAILLVIPRLSIIFCIGVIRIMHVCNKNDSIFR